MIRGLKAIRNRRIERKNDIITAISVLAVMRDNLDTAWKRPSERGREGVLWTFDIAREL